MSEPLHRVGAAVRPVEALLRSYPLWEPQRDGKVVEVVRQSFGDRHECWRVLVQFGQRYGSLRSS